MHHWGVLVGLILLVAGCGSPQPQPPSSEALAVRKHVVKLHELLTSSTIGNATEERRTERIKVLNNLQRSAAVHRDGLSESQAAAVQDAIKAADAYCTYENPAELLPMEVIQLEARCTVSLRRAAEALQEPAQTVRRAK